MTLRAFAYWRVILIMIKVLGLSLYGSQAASPRYRLAQYVPGLRLSGIDLEVTALLGDGYLSRTFQGGTYPSYKLLKDYLRRMVLLSQQRKYDMAILHVELFPFLPGFIESRLLKIPYIYDFDDAFFLKYKAERFKRISFLLEDKFDPVVSRAAAVTAGNQYLAEYAKTWNSAAIWMPTVVDTDRYMHAPRKRDKTFTVGWIGSPSTSVYLSELIQPLSELSREGPVRFVVIGGLCPPINGVDVVQLPWNEDTEVDLINTFDIGVMPLFADEWCKGKCALKLIQYMACGLPVVASPVGANVEVVDAACGFLAENAEAWRDNFRRLRDDVSLRLSMGAAGRKKVENQYSLDRRLPTMVNTIKQVVGGSSQSDE